MEYFCLLIYVVLANVLVSLLVFLANVVSIVTGVPSFDKITAYECGFDPFGDVRIQFNVQFYIVAILFIVFDLEIMFLFPRSLIINFASFNSVVLIILFISVLAVGFAYEWINGALDWSLHVIKFNGV